MKFSNINDIFGTSSSRKNFFLSIIDKFDGDLSKKEIDRRVKLISQYIYYLPVGIINNIDITLIVPSRWKEYIINKCISQKKCGDEDCCYIPSRFVDAGKYFIHKSDIPVVLKTSPSSRYPIVEYMESSIICNYTAFTPITLIFVDDMSTYYDIFETHAKKVLLFDDFDLCLRLRTRSLACVWVSMDDSTVDKKYTNLRMDFSDADASLTIYDIGNTGDYRLRNKCVDFFNTTLSKPFILSRKDSIKTKRKLYNIIRHNNMKVYECDYE